MEKRSDEADASQICDEITHALHKSWFFDPQTITVSESDGVVRLGGTVASSHDRRRAAIAACKKMSTLLYNPAGISQL